MRPGAVTASARLAGLLFLLVFAACGPKGVRSPDWLLAESARYPGGRFLVGVGSAPTAGGVAEALKAASASARAEIAQTIEVRIDHVQELLGQNVTERKRQGRPDTLKSCRSPLILKERAPFGQGVLFSASCRPGRRAGGQTPLPRRAKRH